MQQQHQQQQQQQIAEQNQMGCQQQQQMVLCPVRVVYETQMLMQPGEQMQPNQTIFINPQNPPPWAQNRPVQNQVIYVQQMPGNYMPSVQHHTDPNQLYFQQAYQQIMQQPMIAQNQDLRQYQVNMVPSNMIQNVQSIGSNVPSQVIQQNDRINQPNYIQMPPNVSQNTQISNPNSPQVVNQQNVNVQAMQNQPIMNQRQVYLNTGQQANQHPNIARPQLITVNPMQQSNVQASNQAPNMPINAQGIQPMYTNAMASPQMANNMVQTEPRIRKITPNNTQTQTNMRNIGTNYVYRPIQPRPQFRTQIPTASVQNAMQQTNNIMNIQQIQPNVHQDVRKVNEEQKSRKRKSESPDELTKKVTIVNINTALPQTPMRTLTPAMNPVKSVEIGVNTSPIHRPRIPSTAINPRINTGIINQSSVTNRTTNPLDANVNPNHVLHQPKMVTTAVPSNNIKVNTSTFTYHSKIPVSTVTSNDSKVNINQTESVNIPKNAIPTTDPKVSVKKIDDIKLKEDAVKVTPNTSALEKDKDANINTETNTNVADKIRYTVFPQARTRAPKDEFNKVNVNILKDTKNILYTDEKNEFKLEGRSLLKEKILSRTEIKKEGERSEVKTEEEKDSKPESVKDVKDYVLTHVLDGIVIQESNTAFPIREPTRHLNSAEKKRDVVKVDGMLQDSCLQLPISELKLKEERVEDKPVKEERDNPFADLKTSTVKSWTVDELCSHLTKCKWEECVSLLQEHEIDGESLFLVTKQQLMQIGVKERFADLICEFVKS